MLTITSAASISSRPAAGGPQAGRRRAAAAEVREDIAFCLSSPLDVPRAVLNPRRFPPAMSFSMRGGDPAFNDPMDKVNPGQTDIVC